MHPTLAGHLEDVDLDEVVKVIALSRRSGVLSVRSPGANAEVLFLFGRAVRVQSSRRTETLEQVLQHAGLLGSHDVVGDAGRTIDDVLRLAQERRPAEPGLIGRAEAVIRDKLEEVLVDVLGLREGSFEFKKGEPASPPLRYPKDTALILPDGVDVEQVAREAKKKRLQKRRDPLARVSRGVSRQEDEDSVPELVIVDDDPSFLDAVGREATAAGLEVIRHPDVRGALDALSQLNGETPPRLMLVDLVMPRANGRGILGGLEVLRKAAERGLADRVCLALDEEHADARRVADELGARAVVLKPTGGGGFGPVLNPILEHFGRPRLVDEPIDLVSELRLELGEAGTDWTAEPDLNLDDAGRALEVLKSLLGQVNDPTYEEEIPLLLLRFAAAFFSRGALFGAHGDSGVLVGLGGYGVSSADPGRTLHALRMPLDADTVFTRAIRERCGVRQPFYDSEYNLKLLDTLGGPRPREVYTAPLRSPRGLEAVLYADNALDNRPFPDIALLEIFVQQAGVAIERSSLVRQIEAMLAGRAPAAGLP